MLGLDNPVHLLFLLVILLLLFGAKRLPEMGRSLGAGLRGFKESISGDPPMAQADQLPPSTTGPPDSTAATPGEASDTAGGAAVEVLLDTKVRSTHE